MTPIAWPVCGIFETFEAPKRYYKQTGAGFVVPARPIHSELQTARHV